MKQGQLYRFNEEGLTPRFCEVQNGLLQNDRAWSQWSIIAKGDVVMFIEKLAYTEKTTDGGGLDGRIARSWEEITRLWNKNQSIPGSIYLHPTGKIIWISDVDIKYFERIEQ